MFELKSEKKYFAFNISLSNRLGCAKFANAQPEKKTVERKMAFNSILFYPEVGGEGRKKLSHLSFS